MAQWHQQHPEYSKEYQKRWRARHPNYSRDYMKRYRAAGYKAKESMRPWYYKGVCHDAAGRSYGGKSWRAIVRVFLGL